MIVGIFSCITIHAQTIKVLNILDYPLDIYPISIDARVNGPDRGYHLAGKLGDPYYDTADMQDARAKLLNPANFGPTGTVPHTITITDDYGTYGSIPGVAALNPYDIIFIGVKTGAGFSPAEVGYLLAWSKQPGKVLMLQEQSWGSPVSTAMGYQIIDGSNTNPTTALPEDISYGTKLFSGAFGDASMGIDQWGASQGYFTPGCTGIALAKNANGLATVILNTEYRDILVADGDFFTKSWVGNGLISAGPSITNDTDRVWGNLWAWAINEVVNQVEPSPLVPTGIAYTDQTLPLCNTDAIIKLDGNNASVIRWETSTDGGTTWLPITSTDITITYPNPVNNQQFRAVLQNSPSCPIGYSMPVTITVNCTVCNAGTVAPVLTNATVTSNMVDLNSMITGTLPTGITVQWHTIPNPLDNTTQLSGTTVNATSTPVNYYAVFYDTVNNCYSPSAKVVVVSNVCPMANADLTALLHSSLPANTTLVWYKDALRENGGTLVTDPAMAGNGTYWPYFYDADNTCYSPAGTPVIVGLTSCNNYCYKQGITTGTALGTKVGITALNRAGTQADNWPMVRKGSWIALESKTKGFVPNRVAFDGSGNPVGIPVANFVEGMIVYDTTNKCLKMYTSKDGGPLGWYCISTQTCPD